MNMIEQIKADREAGTAGPWCTDTEDQGGAGSDAYVSVGDGSQYVARIICYSPLTLHDRPYKENARRIARVPDMEAALIAADELVTAYAVYESRASQDLAEDWASMGKALVAYYAAIGDA